MKIQQRDLEILKFCLEQKFLTLLQIAKMFFSDSRDILHRPMKRMCELVEAGLLRVERPKITDKRFYVTAPEGVKLLKQHNLAGGLRAVKKVDYRYFEHDEWVTDVRIIFERLLDIKGWVPERALKKKNARKKVPDGIIPYHKWNLVIEVEKTLKNKLYYERVFINACIRDHKDDEILYIMANETDKKWLMKQAEGWKNIYFATMEDLTAIKWDVIFENESANVREFDREYQGGVHFNAPVRYMDDGLDEIHAGEREREAIEAEHKRLKAQGMSDEEIDKLWGIADVDEDDGKCATF